eukprot:jgi/Pico_ML_1/52772/g3432.t1
MSSSGVRINARICSSVNVHGGLALTREGAPFLPKEPLLRVRSSCEVLVLRCEALPVRQQFAAFVSQFGAPRAFSAVPKGHVAVVDGEAIDISGNGFPFASVSPSFAASSLDARVRRT